MKVKEQKPKMRRGKMNVGTKKGLRREHGGDTGMTEGKHKKRKRRRKRTVLEQRKGEGDGV